MTNDLSHKDIQNILARLEEPFPITDVKWRVTATSGDKKSGLVAPYADPRTYFQRLNDVFTPAGWTCTYTTTAIPGLTRMKDGKPVSAVKLLTIATLDIFGVGSKTSMSEKWADDDNAVTAAEAQSFKRAASQFGLGKYFYEIKAPEVKLWVPIDQKKVPTQTPNLPARFLPRGAQPQSRQQNNGGANGNSQQQGNQQRQGTQQGNQRQTTSGETRKTAEQLVEEAKPKAIEILGQPLYANLVYRVEVAEKEGKLNGDRHSVLLNYLRNTRDLLNRVRNAAADMPQGALESLLDRKQVKRFNLIPSFDVLADLAKEMDVPIYPQQQQSKAA
jgi:hypothetical protein